MAKDVSKKIKNVIFACSIVFDLLIIDLLSKYAVRWGWIAKTEIWPGIFSITEHHNYGLIGNFALPFWLIIILVAVALGFLVFGMKQALDDQRNGELFALAVVAGGALGNFTDRLVNGYVFDWLLFFNTSIINLADAMISVGVVVYLLLRIKNNKKDNV